MSDERGRYRSGVTLPGDLWDWLSDTARRDGTTRDDLLEGLVLLGRDADTQSVKHESGCNWDHPADGACHCGARNRRTALTAALRRKR